MLQVLFDFSRSTGSFSIKNLDSIENFLEKVYDEKNNISQKIV